MGMENEIKALGDLAADMVSRAIAGGADVAEAIARSGSELSTKVRLGEPELVEEAAHKSLGMRIIRDKRVALTTTSDLTPRGLDRFLRDALELVEISQEDPFAGPADPELIARGAVPDLDLYDPAGGEVTAASQGLGHGSTFTLRLPILTADDATRLEDTPRLAEPALHEAQPVPSSGGRRLE